MPRKKAADKEIGQDALLTVTVKTADGSESRTYRVSGFRGNTLQWQRKGEGLDALIIPGLRHAFGGQVEAE